MGLEAVLRIVTLSITLVAKTHDPLSSCKCGYKTLDVDYNYSCPVHKRNLYSHKPHWSRNNINNAFAKPPEFYCSNNDPRAPKEHLPKPYLHPKPLNPNP